MSGSSGNPPDNLGNSRSSRSSRDSGNYDYPPASVARPSRFADGHLTDQSFRERYPHTQYLIHQLNRQNPVPLDSSPSPWLRLIENVGNGETTDSLSELLRISEEHRQQAEGTSRENQQAVYAGHFTRDRLHYLRSLLESGNNRFNAEETTRALETLNREAEEQFLTQRHDQNSRSESRSEEAPPFSIPRPPQIDFASLRSNHSTLWDQVQAESRFSASDSARTTPHQDPIRPTISNRTLRRRSVRPDLRSSSNLDDISIPPLMPQSASAPSGREGRARLKRRKLDSDDHREGVRGFNYGHYGQVVPGALKMEIASCDGGTFDPDGDSSFPDNLLRNDQSVYCTKSDRCNIILRHRGEAPFCLKKIVIKAPRSGFDSPIQEGMVFVSMTSDELLARTAQHQIQISSQRRRRRNRRSGLQPSQEYLSAHRPPLQSLDRTVPMGSTSQSASDNDPAACLAYDPQAEFHVTTEYDEQSEDNLFIEHRDDERPTVAEVERVEDDDFCSDSDDSISDDEELEDPNNAFRRRIELQRQHRIRLASLVNPIPPPSSAPVASRRAPPDLEILKPHAQFFIEREKSMVSIKFDPPPSGRFILVKLWSPRNDGNIDIQSIIAHGYAGSRYFPSGGFR